MDNVDCATTGEKMSKPDAIQPQNLTMCCMPVVSINELLSILMKALSR